MKKKTKIAFLGVLYFAWFSSKIIPNVSLSREGSSQGPKDCMERRVSNLRCFTFCLQSDPWRHFAKAAHTSEVCRSERLKIGYWAEFFEIGSQIILGMDKLRPKPFFLWRTVPKSRCFATLKFVRNRLFWQFQFKLWPPKSPFEPFWKDVVGKDEQLPSSHCLVPHENRQEGNHTTICSLPSAHFRTLRAHFCTLRAHFCTLPLTSRCLLHTSALRNGLRKSPEGRLRCGWVSISIAFALVPTIPARCWMGASVQWYREPSIQCIWRYFTFLVFVQSPPMPHMKFKFFPWSFPMVFKPCPNTVYLRWDLKGQLDGQIRVWKERNSKCAKAALPSRKLLRIPLAEKIWRALSS